VNRNDLVKAWKDPSYRERAGVSISHPAGEVLTEISDEELMRVNGGAGVEPQATPTTVSSAWCVSAGIGTGLLLTFTVCKN
jgi:mersacidin/lichenicidin family type 2 lantibiotic